MTEYHDHRDDCRFKFATLDACDCAEKNMLDRIEALIAENAKLHDHIEGVAKGIHKIMVGYEAKLARAKWLLTDAAVQLEEGKIKTRRNRAGLIWQFLEEIKAT